MKSNSTGIYKFIRELLKKAGAPKTPASIHLFNSSLQFVRRMSYVARVIGIASYTVYVLALTSPPVPVQFVWKNLPRAESSLSYVWAPK